MICKKLWFEMKNRGGHQSWSLRWLLLISKRFQDGYQQIQGKTASSV
jgi:hypothetical protein